jgi:chromosome segregation ATPase
MATNKHIDNLEAKIDSKVKALQNLTNKLNNAEDSTKASLTALNESVEKRRLEVYEELSRLESQLSKPNESITSVYEELRKKEVELEGVRSSLQELSNDLLDRESALDEHELLLTESGDEILEAWTKLVQSLYSDLRSSLDSVKNREEMLEKRRGSLDMRQNRLHDQIRTFRAAQTEIIKR